MSQSASVVARSIGLSILAWTTATALSADRRHHDAAAPTTAGTSCQPTERFAACPATSSTVSFSNIAACVSLKWQRLPAVIDLSATSDHAVDWESTSARSPVESPAVCSMKHAARYQAGGWSPACIAVIGRWTRWLLRSIRIQSWWPAIAIYSASFTTRFADKISGLQSLYAHWKMTVDVARWLRNGQRFAQSFIITDWTSSARCL